MDTVVVAHTATARRVYLDAHAAAADRIIPVNRIKPHTCFKGPIESGLHEDGRGRVRQAAGRRPGPLLRPGRDARPPARRHRRAARRPGGCSAASARSSRPPATSSRVDALTADEVGGDRRARAHRVRPGARAGTAVRRDRRARSSSAAARTSPAPRSTPTSPGDSGCRASPTPSHRVVSARSCCSASPRSAPATCSASVSPTSSRRRWPTRSTGRRRTSTASRPAAAGVRRARLPMVLPDEESCIKAALSMCGKAFDEPKRVVRITSTLHLTRCWVSDALLGELPAAARVVSS